MPTLYKLGELPGTEAGCCLGTGLASVSGWWETVLCITCFSWVLYFFLSLLNDCYYCCYYIIISIISIIVFYFVSIIKCPFLNPFFWFFSPIPLKSEEHWSSGCSVLSCQLGLNPNNIFLQRVWRNCVDFWAEEQYQSLLHN